MRENDLRHLSRIDALVVQRAEKLALRRLKPGSVAEIEQDELRSPAQDGYVGRWPDVRRRRAGALDHLFELIGRCVLRNEGRRNDHVPVAEHFDVERALPECSSARRNSSRTMRRPYDCRRGPWPIAPVYC